MAKKRSPSRLAFKCLTFQQAGHTLVSFACSAKKLWSIVQVNQREEDGHDGYQRAASPSRVTKISDFIDAKNPIPTSVLISFKYASLSADEKTLYVRNRQDAGWVIDGQHRLAGGKYSMHDILLPVVAFIDLDITDQINCFVTINKEQRGVSSSLYLELLKSLPGVRNQDKDAKERAVDLAHKLRQDDQSPFFGRIVSTTSPRKGELSLTNFVRKVQSMLKLNTGRLATLTDEGRCNLLNNYYKGLQQVFPKEYAATNSVFFRTLGFGALMGVLPTFIDITLGAYGKFRVIDAAKTFKGIGDFDFASWRGLSGSGTEAVMTADLRDAIMGQTQHAHGAGVIAFQ